MGNQRLRDILAHAGRRMAVELNQRLIPHRGEQGSAREEVVREFLRRHLPKRFEISTGFVFDAGGQVSEQLDIIIADASLTPRFEVTGDTRFYPCEAVVAAGEVRSSITSRSELWDALTQIRSVSNLDRSANGQAVCHRTGERIDHKANHLHRIFTFVLILDRAPTPDLTVEVLLDLVHRSDPHEWPNVIFALDSYLITYACDHGVCPNTHDARGIAKLVGRDTSDTLLKFYLFLSQALAVSSVAQLPGLAYLDEFVQIRGQVLHGTSNEDGDPPPYLSAYHILPWMNPYESHDRS